MRPIDNWYFEKDEPVRSCLQFLRTHISQLHPSISEAWKYSMPFFCCDGKMFCYLWIHKKFKQPYLGIVDGNSIDHPDLIVEKRARMKILLLDPAADLPIEKINFILMTALKYKITNRK
ncbi:MAG: DUF1801 domain-containing protein [Chitinophagaceae bacterium]|nr:DUF1801 domain-containing protein [Chitinophagaceae bacterium]